MIDKQGNPKVIEFNCRFGDPETQPIMLRMKSDLVELCTAACEGKLDEKTSEWDERASLGVVMAAGGYPGDYRTGDVIHGLPLEEVSDGKVFHAGTKLADDEQVVTSGGRVLCVTALSYCGRSAETRLCLNDRYPLGRLLLPERYRLARYRTRAELTRQFANSVLRVIPN